jgi:hypothetical protein
METIIKLITKHKGAPNKWRGRPYSEIINYYQ